MGWEEVRYEEGCGESVFGRGDSKIKGFMVEMELMCLRKRDC